LTMRRSLPHGPTFRLGRPILNEVFYLAPRPEIEALTLPVLVVHGTRDTFIPVSSSRDLIGRMGGNAKLLEIEGAQHGFAVHDDPGYLDPQTQEWQAFVIEAIANWVSNR
jgi:uncharacterized protein